MNQFTIKDWQEDILVEAKNGVKTSCAKIETTYKGVLEGSGQLVYSMLYLEDGTADFVGHEWFEGSIDGKAGSCVLYHQGKFAQGSAKGELSIVELSQTGELIGTNGQGSFQAGHGGVADYEFSLSPK